MLDPGAGGILDGEGVTVEVIIAFKSLDENEIGREPDRAAPVRVSAEHVGGGLAGCVFHLVGLAGVLEDEGLVQVDLREGADSEIG